MSIKAIIPLSFSLLLSLLSAKALADDASSSDPCGGATAMLSIVDRPSNADSACAVPYKQSVVEMGMQLNKLPGSGSGYDVPESEYRLGLPWQSELFVLLPNYFHQTVAPSAGLTATVIGLKHELLATSTLQTTIEGEVITPTGSASYGSAGTGATINGIISYAVASSLNLTVELGLTTASAPNNSGGGRYNSFNPDAILTYNIIPTIDIYGEIYGQTRTAPNIGSGFNFDGGVIYLFNKNMTIDAEVGQRISGTLQGFQHYVGAGFAVKF